MFVKIYFYKLAFTLKHYKLMRQYLARNLKADPNILVLLTYVSTEIGTVTQRSLYRDLFDSIRMAWTLPQKYLYVKPRLLMKKC